MRKLELDQFNCCLIKQDNHSLFSVIRYAKLEAIPEEHMWQMVIVNLGNYRYKCLKCKIQTYYYVMTGYSTGLLHDSHQNRQPFLVAPFLHFSPPHDGIFHPFLVCTLSILALIMKIAVCVSMSYINVMQYKEYIETTGAK